MNKSGNIFEIITGTLVLLCAVIFLTNSLSKSSSKTSSSNYLISAKFNNIDGVSSGSDVKISGVKVGLVKDIDIDNNSYQAILYLSINKDIKLPFDSSVKVASEGLLGSKYIAISPGSDEEYLIDGDEIEFTQSSVNLEELLGKFIFSSKNEDNKNE